MFPYIDHHSLVYIEDIEQGYMQLHVYTSTQNLSLTGLHPLIQIMYLRGAYTNFLRLRWGEGGGYVTMHLWHTATLLWGGGGGGGTGSFIPVQLRGVRMCGGVVGLTVWDVVLPPPPPRGVWGHALTEMDVLRHSGAF